MICDTKICRLCKNEIKESTSLKMSPFPKAAQYYPQKDEFKNDIGIDLEIYQCPNCNLLQLCCEPVSYYKEVITAASFSKDAKESRLKEFLSFVERFNLKDKKAIEVGCGKGPMVEILSQSGLDAIGLEYSNAFVEYGKTEGRKLIQGYLNELDDSYNSKYDAFISLNYIEHQPDTKEFIQSLLRITKDNAVGYITAPNVSYLLKTNTLYEFVADHLIYFTEETMRRAFETNGFDVIKSEIINNENDIALTVKKRKIEKISGNDDVNRLINELVEFTDIQGTQGKKIAVWGAGHRTLALLSISKVKNIDCIVDSADFKQGKYSPVTHLPIISPQTLEESDIDIVLVMVPGLYPDEVVKSIQGFKKEFIIYKLQDNKLIKIDNKL